MNNLVLSDVGVDLIVEFEGLRLNPYPDSRGFATVGIGHLIRNGPVLSTDLPITKPEAYDIFRKDSSVAQWAVNAYVTASITQNQFDALVCFTFNVGSGNFRLSSVLTTVNESQFASVPQHLALYNESGGKVLPGLVRRRAAESALFMKV